MSNQSVNNSTQPVHIPRVSIGFPVYNAQHSLRKALDSILAQTFTDFELCISDNCSTDSTPEIVKEYMQCDSRIRFERQDKNTGIQNNLNHTARMSRGEYFKWTANDVIHDPTFLERCVKVLDEDQSIVCCHTRSDYMDFEGNRLYGADRSGDADLASSMIAHRRFADVLFNHGWGARVFALMRREPLMKTGLLEYHYGWDKVMMAGLGLFGRYHIIDEVLFLELDHETIEVGRSGKSGGLSKSGLPATNDREGKSFHRWSFMRGYLQMAWRFSPNLYTALRCTGWICLYPLQIGKWRRLMWAAFKRSSVSKFSKQLFSGGAGKQRGKAVVDEHA